MYKTLQLSVQQKEGFGNDHNAIVLRMLADSLEAVEQYGTPQSASSANGVLSCISSTLWTACLFLHLLMSLGQGEGQQTKFCSRKYHLNCMHCASGMPRQSHPERCQAASRDFGLSAITWAEAGSR